MKKNTKILLAVISCVFAVLSLVLLAGVISCVVGVIQAYIYSFEKYGEFNFGSMELSFEIPQMTFFSIIALLVSLACIFSSIVIFFLLNPSEKLKAGYNKWATERKRKKLEKLQTELEDVSESNDGQ